MIFRKKSCTFISLHYIWQTGLLDHWQTKWFLSHRAAAQQCLDRSPKKTPVQLSLMHLSSIFLLFGAGLIASVASFLLEFIASFKNSFLKWKVIDQRSLFWTYNVVITIDKIINIKQYHSVKCFFPPSYWSCVSVIIWKIQCIHSGGSHLKNSFFSGKRSWKF